MPKRVDEELEALHIMHQTLQMMLQLMKDLGFEPSDVHEHQGMNRTKAATIQDERTDKLYQGYAEMLEQQEKLKIKIDTLMAKNEELLLSGAGTAGNLAAKGQLDPQGKKANNRKTKRRGNIRARPKRR
jgi:hypothetical protein